MRGTKRQERCSDRLKAKQTNNKKVKNEEVKEEEEDEGSEDNTQMPQSHRVEPALKEWLEDEYLEDALEFLLKEGYKKLSIVALLEDKEVSALNLHPRGLALSFNIALKKLRESSYQSSATQSPTHSSRTPEATTEPKPYSSSSSTLPSSSSVATDSKQQRIVRKKKHCLNCHEEGTIKHKEDDKYWCEPCKKSFRACGYAAGHKEELRHQREEEKQKKQLEKAEAKAREQRLKNEKHEWLKLKPKIGWPEFLKRYSPLVRNELDQQLGPQFASDSYPKIPKTLLGVWRVRSDETAAYNKAIKQVIDELRSKALPPQEELEYIKQRVQVLLCGHHEEEIEPPPPPPIPTPAPLASSVILLPWKPTTEEQTT